MSFIIWCVIFFLFSCLDLVTTYSGMGNIPPSEMEKKELNPLFKRIIAKKPLVWIIKLLVTGIIVFLLTIQFYSSNGYPDSALKAIAILAIALILVVLQNTYAAWATRHKHLSLGRFLMGKLHLNSTVVYFIVVSTILGLAWGIASIIY